MKTLTILVAGLILLATPHFTLAQDQMTKRAETAVKITEARKANASCGTATDCVMTSSDTACSGACGVAVSKSGEAAFQSALAYADGAYCSGFVPVCGYSSPKCAQATLECNAGSCEAKYN